MRRKRNWIMLIVLVLYLGYGTGCGGKTKRINWPVPVVPERPPVSFVSPNHPDAKVCASNTDMKSLFGHVFNLETEIERAMVTIQGINASE